MRILKSTLLLSLFLFSLSAHSASCHEHLEPVSSQMGATELFSGFLRVSSQREIYVRIQKPRTARKKEAVLLVHGLLDSQKRFDKITQNLLQSGHPVIRVDVFGFGKSLINELERNNQSLGFLKELPFQTNVEDLKDVVRWLESEFRLGPLQVVGHSMGGGLLGALAADPAMKDHLERVLLIAPYIYRLDRYHLENLFWNPFGYLSPWIEGFLLLNDPMIDHMFLNSHLSHQFSQHLDEVAKEGRRQNKKIDGALKEALVTSAIATVKGLRDLNLMDLVHHFPNSLPVDVVITGKDELVPLGLQQKFADELKRRRAVQGKESQVYRLNLGHMAPTEDPDALSDLISHR